MKVIATVRQTPEEVLDWAVNWATVLGSDTIESSAWTTQGPGQIDRSTMDTRAVTIWVSGISAETILTNQITTAAGRVFERSIIFTPA